MARFRDICHFVSKVKPRHNGVVFELIKHLFVHTVHLIQFEILKLLQMN